MSLLPMVLACAFAPAPFPRPIHAYLGVDLVPGKEMKLASVFAASPAQKAGLQMFDVLVALDGKKVDSPDHLTALLSKRKPGNALDITIRRNNVEHKVRLTLAARSIVPYLGVSLVRLDALKINVVADNSPASAAGLQVNDVVLDVDDAKFTSTADLAAFLRKKKPGDVVTVALRRDNQNRRIKVKLGTRPGY